MLSFLRALPNAEKHREELHKAEKAPRERRQLWGKPGFADSQSAFGISNARKKRQLPFPKLPALRAEVTAPARNKRRGFLLLSLSSSPCALSRARRRITQTRVLPQIRCALTGDGKCLLGGVVSYPYPPSNVSATPGVYGRILAQTASLISELTMPAARRLV